jgi:cytochrome c55X
MVNVMKEFKIITYTILVFVLFNMNLAVYAESQLVTHSNITSQRQDELHSLLVQDCGSCHGMTLKGGLGPALTVDALKDKSRQMIELTILHGRPGTPMPPWENILSADEVKWLVDVLYAGIQ